MSRRCNFTGRTCRKVSDELLHLVYLPLRGESVWQSIHWLKLLVSQVHVLACLATQGHLEFAKSSVEFNLVCTYKLVTLLAMQNEIELRDRLHLESLSSFPIVICLNCTEDDVFVAVRTSSSFIGWLESHARTAPR